MNTPIPKIISVAKEHIELGLKKYSGVEDIHLKNILNSAGLKCTPYLFTDGRILLKYDFVESAILYPSKEVLFDKLQLDD